MILLGCGSRRGENVTIVPNRNGLSEQLFVNGTVLQVSPFEGVHLHLHVSICMCQHVALCISCQALYDITDQHAFWHVLLTYAVAYINSAVTHADLDPLDGIVLGILANCRALLRGTLSYCSAFAQRLKLSVAHGHSD